jgi:hypothetical protein
MAKITLLRIAKALVKHELRQRGVKVSQVGSKSITKAAKHLVRVSPRLVNRVKRDILGRQS